MEGGLLSLKWNNHRSSFIHVLSSLRKKDSYCDVTIACDGKFYPSHKFVLSTCSEYFQEMFQHTDCKHPVIVLKDIRCDDIESLLNYMYVGEVNVLQEKLSTLIKAAECLKIKGLAVPDDPPGEKRSFGHDSVHESKRRKTDPEYQRYKESTKSVAKSSKFSDAPYRQSINEPTTNFRSSNSQSDNETKQNFNDNVDHNAIERLTSDVSSSDKQIKEIDGALYIKQEPTENVIDIEDSKEGILEATHGSFLSPLTQEENSNTEHMGSSESQDIWNADSLSVDNYPPLEEGNSGGDPADEDGTQNEAEWREGASPKDWKQERATTIARTSPWKSQPQPNSSSTVDDPLWDTFPPEAGPDGCCQEIFGTLKYECSICSKGFDHKGNYRKHMRTHTGERPFECPVCRYSASQKGNLQVHIKRMHPDRNLLKPESI